MSEHSPEPWVIGEMTCLGGGMNGHHICDAADQSIFRDAAWMKDLDAERIVACVNACAGLSETDLEALQEHGPAGYRRFVIRQFLGVLVSMGHQDKINVSPEDIHLAIEEVAAESEST